MKKEIKEILAEIYQLDPELKKQERELIKLVEELKRNKPEIKFDQQFAKELRARLMERAKELQEDQEQNYWRVFKANKFLIFSAVSLSVIFFIISLGQFLQNNDQNGGFNFSQKGFAVVKTQDQAFGSLVALARSDSNNALGLGGGGGEMAPVLEGDMAAKSSMIMPVDINQYKYVYVGDDFEAGDSEQEVLRRIRGGVFSLAGNILDQAGLGLLDMSKFEQVKAQNLNFVEDRDYGLAFGINFEEGSISIYQNWEKWPNQNTGSFDSKNIPDDQAIINLADEFLEKYQIDTSVYQSGEVDKSFGGVLKEDVVSLESAYVSETAAVIYPLKLGDREIYNQSGEREGLRVNVNLSLMKVTGVYGLTNQEYQASLYAVETDKDVLLDYVGSGGLNARNYGSGEVKEVKVGTPQKIYLKLWRYNNNQAEELIVPALIFPIIEKPAGDEFFWRDNIVVPLVKDILEENNNDNVDNPIKIMR